MAKIVVSNSTLEFTDDFPSGSTNIPSGGFTNDQTLTLSGVADFSGTGGQTAAVNLWYSVDGGTTIVSLASNVALTNVSGTSGTWTFTTNFAATAGTTYSFYVTDNSFKKTSEAVPNNVVLKTAGGGTATVETVHLDTVAPAAAGTLGYANLSDSGTVGDGITNDNNFNLSLSGNEPGATVVYEVSTDGGTNWSTTNAAQSNLADGSYQFHARVTDAAGNTSISNSTATVTIDTHGPSVAHIDLSTPLEFGSDHLKAGDVVSATVLMTENVTIDTSGGTPHLALNIGGATVNAVYVSGSGTNTLSFEYAIQAGQTDSDGVSIAANALNANGAIFSKDIAGNDTVLTHGAVTTGIVVDTTAPTTIAAVTNIEDHAGPIQGGVASGGVTDDINPIVTGTLGASLADDEQLHVFDGSTDLGLATVTGSTWTFTDVADGRVLDDGQVVSYTARVVDLAGNVGPAGGAAYTVTIDTSGPQVTDAYVSGAAFHGSYLTTGDTVTITASMSELTYVTGAPQLTLDIGGVSVNASYVGGDGTDQLQFAYTIEPGLKDLDGITATALNLHGGDALTDAAGNVATLTFASINVDLTGSFPVDAPVTPTITSLIDNEPGPDLAHPTPTGPVTPGGTTDDFTPELHGTALAGSFVEIFNAVDGSFLAATIAAGDGTWTYTFGGDAVNGWELSPDNSFGQFAFYVTATDALGSTSAPSDQFSVTIQETAVCFLAGTLIATATGERSIESLAIGDMITLADGTQKPIKWVGRMTVNLNRFNRHTASPILIRAGALGGGLPKRDLYTTYYHGFELEGLLVHAGLLVNGTSIVQCADWPESSVTYYQVEVEGHELMLVEGSSAETFGDTGEVREQFDNADEFRRLYPDAPSKELMTMGHVTLLRQLPRSVKARIETAAVEMGYETWVAAA